MKIVNRDEFLKCPAGTIFSHYQDVIFEGLMVKGDSIVGDDGDNIDFWYENLIGNIKSSGSNDFIDKILRARESESSLELEWDSHERDGLYDKEQLYAVYDKKDHFQLIQNLSRVFGFPGSIPEPIPKFQEGCASFSLNSSNDKLEQQIFISIQDRIVENSTISPTDAYDLCINLGIRHSPDYRINKIIELANRGNKPHCIYEMLKDE